MFKWSLLSTDVCYNQRSTQISTRPRATKQGRVKCRRHVPFQRSQHREQSRRRADTKKICGSSILFLPVEHRSTKVSKTVYKILTFTPPPPTPPHTPTPNPYPQPPKNTLNLTPKTHQRSWQVKHS